jgi:hypothetical protein
MKKNIKNFLKYLKTLPSNFLEKVPNKFLPKFLRKKTANFSNFVDIPTVSFDPKKTKAEKQKNERRKRNQVYVALDYLLSQTSYFDFFSIDTFQVAKYAKYLAQIVEETIVSSDFLLLAFFSINSPVCDILKKYKLTQQNIGEILEKSYKKTPLTPFKKKINFFTKFLETIRTFFPFFRDSISLSSNQVYSLETEQIFEKTAENALTRFKSPVISTEMLLITLMEERDTKAGKIIKSFLENETEWYLLRYSLLKRVYKQEAYIRAEIPRNLQYFAYLLKIKSSDIDFEGLITKNQLLRGVSLFRNEVIRQVLSINIHDVLRKDVYKSIRANIFGRKYSTEEK